MSLPHLEITMPKAHKFPDKAFAKLRLFLIEIL